MDVKSIRQQVRQWDWKGLVRDARSNAMEMLEAPDDYDQEAFERDETGKIIAVLSPVHLGSCLSLAPSGKYYMPWACSNLDTCTWCNGSGDGKEIPCKYCDGTGRRSFAGLAYDSHQTVTEVKLRVSQNSPDLIIDDLHLTCWVCHGSGLVHETCKHCGGLGSRDAYLDQTFYDELDKCASRVGGSIYAGEGDATDLFFTVWVDVKRETAKQTVKRFVNHDATYGELREASRDL